MLRPSASSPPGIGRPASSRFDTTSNPPRCFDVAVDVHPESDRAALGAIRPAGQTASETATPGVERTPIPEPTLRHLANSRQALASSELLGHGEQEGGPPGRELRDGGEAPRGSRSLRRSTNAPGPDLTHPAVRVG
jgi:hypothetical protein